MNFEEMVQKTINAKVKAGLKSSAIVQDSDIRCPRDHHLSNSTASKVQTKQTTVKESRSKEFRLKEAKSVKEKTSALLQTNVAESSKQGKKDRKIKKWRF